MISGIDFYIYSKPTETNEFNSIMDDSSIAGAIDINNRNNVFPPFVEYQGQTSYFPAGESPLPLWVGYVVVIGFGLLFSVITTAIVYINKYFGTKGEITSEHFK